MSKTFRVAKTLCELSGWSLTNLQIQNILYIAHRVYLGRTGKELVDYDFHAWDYGPVIPSVYKECKMYGNKPVKSAFLLSGVLSEGDEREIIKEAYEHLKEFSGGQLVSMTHMKGGAWEYAYIPGARDVVISNKYILKEYNDINENK